MQRECTTTELVDEIERLRKALRNLANYVESLPYQKGVDVLVEARSVLPESDE